MFLVVFWWLVCNPLKHCAVLVSMGFTSVLRCLQLPAKLEANTSSHKLAYLEVVTLFRKLALCNLLCARTNCLSLHAASTWGNTLWRPNLALSSQSQSNLSRYLHVSFSLPSSSLSVLTSAVVLAYICYQYIKGSGCSASRWQHWRVITILVFQSIFFLQFWT